MKHLVTVAAAVVAVGVGVGAALVTTSAAPTAVRYVPVTVSDAACGESDGWRMSAGRASFDVTSSAAGYSAVYLESAAGDVVAEVPSIGKGATRTLPTTLRRGTYRIRCVLTDATVRRSGPVRVTGDTTTAATGYRPMRSVEMVAAVQAYTGWVGDRLPGLLADCRRLDADVARGDLAAARADWLSAHLDYERLGAAYGAFGDYDAEINELAGGQPHGTATSGWAGFHAIEHALWAGGPVARTRTLTRQLVADAAGLLREWPSDEVDPGDLPLRAHEILENALQTQLTGEADYGSGTTLATTYANAEGTEELLTALASLLRDLDPTLLADARRGLATVQADLRAERSHDGRWTSAADLTPAARTRIDGDTGALLETLARLPAVMAPRNGA